MTGVALARTLAGSDMDSPGRPAAAPASRSVACRRRGGERRRSRSRRATPSSSMPGAGFRQPQSPLLRAMAAGEFGVDVEPSAASKSRRRAATAS